MDLLLTQTYIAESENLNYASTAEPVSSMAPDANDSASGTLVVTVVGLAVVFIGLVLLIAIVKLIGAVCKAAFGENKKAEKSVQPAVKGQTNRAVTASNLTEAQRGELIAAISCAIAENMGKPVSGIRIRSIRKVG